MTIYKTWVWAHRLLQFKAMPEGKHFSSNDLLQTHTDSNLYHHHQTLVGKDLYTATTWWLKATSSVRWGVTTWLQVIPGLDCNPMTQPGKWATQSCGSLWISLLSWEDDIYYMKSVTSIGSSRVWEVLFHRIVSNQADTEMNIHIHTPVPGKCAL